MGFSTTTSRTKPGRHAPLADINVTPLVDVMLVLLIVFIITAPLLAAGLRVDLPKASAALPQAPKDPIVITITKEGRIVLDGADVARERLAEAVKAMMGAETRAIHLRGDRDVPYGEIIAVMDQLASHDLTRIALIANTQGGSRSPPADASPGQPAAPSPQ
jgi:biopolymer transport protein ExbD